MRNQPRFLLFLLCLLALFRSGSSLQKVSAAGSGTVLSGTVLSGTVLSGTVLSGTFLSEETLLRLMEQDLERADPQDRPFLRYFSLAHLSNAGASRANLEVYRIGLSVLLNSLSWHPSLRNPVPVDETGTLFRIDLRWFRWKPETWNLILGHYPYAIHTAHTKRVEELMGVPVPYIRADWFAAKASVSPLYEQILGLPRTQGELEDLLRLNRQIALDAEFDVVRAGIHRSGETGRPRIIERYATSLGAYWRTLDFDPDADIVRDPLVLKAPGSEVLFTLPNGLQVYYNSDAGEPLRESSQAEPSFIGREIQAPSCMSCHSQGIAPFKEEVRSAAASQLSSSSTLDRILALYPEQPALDKLLEEDRTRFHRALEAIEPGAGSGAAPVNTLARQYSGDLSQAKMAAEVGLQSEDFRARVVKNRDLAAAGFKQLFLDSGQLSRQTWEDYFPDVAEGLQVGSVSQDQQATPAPNVIPHYSMGGIFLSPGAPTMASGLNAHGEVVGSATISYLERGFIIQPLRPIAEDLGTLGGDDCSAVAINRAGSIVGFSHLSHGASWHAFRSRGKTLQDLGTLGGANSFAMGINRPGQVAGYSNTRNGVEHAFRTGLGLPINPAADDLGTLGGLESRAFGLNDSGQVVGLSTTAGRHAHAFRTAPGRPIDSKTDDLGTLGGSTSTAWAINNSGDVVGSAMTPGDASYHAFLLHGAGPMQDLGTLPGYNSSTARGINRSGQVVGYCENLALPGSALVLGEGGAYGGGPAESTAFLYVNGVMQDLNTLIPANNGWRLWKAMAINEEGQVVGWGDFRGRIGAFLLIPR